ncbi:MAG: TIGR02680 family protein [Actinomycetota bacterium]|nr:TIGR02680 family protein [Actinomycetota bacterium]
MGDRWVLNRAGILNVYQYGDETLTFAGGRLLLRGVNGSGKSTAMNMLLPFLLDGDTRKIDAAGEQSGVLKAWMLSGRDDPQPIGYLWIEFARGGEYVTCGCGIKASRSTDSVSTWWWVTPRRPGVDLDLVQDRRPLTAEALRAVLGSDAVFRQEERRSYRDAVRQRLYGGADIEQHIRLLHVVRNPRVGDRVEQELASHLHDALPQLSETALTDAAQPLDDLEEHRRNVEELARTAASLTALNEIYADYARSELRRRAARAHEVATAAERAQREAARARAESRRAEQAVQAAADRVETLEADERRLGTEVESLRRAPEYAEGRRLEDLRARVKVLAVAVERASEQLAGRRATQVQVRREVVNTARTAREDHATLEGLSRDLAAHAVAAGLTTAAPDVPLLRAEALDEEEGVLEAPGEFADAVVAHRLTELIAAASHRRGDIDEVRGELRRVGVALQRLERAAEVLAAAESELSDLDQALARRTSELDRAISEWRESLGAWVARLADRLEGAGLPGVGDLDLGHDLADRRSGVAGALTAAAEGLIGHHERAFATLEVAEQQQKAEAHRLAAELAELEATTLPDPPVLPWQRPGRGPVLGELVDFNVGTDDTTRAAIEAAMEASGLLTAEVGADGAVALAEGTLVAAPTAAAKEPLSRYLSAVDPADGAVARILESVSTDPSDLEREDRTVVTLDGRFRIGVLTGRHAKARAEHLGLAARQARLERQRMEARRQLELAEATHRQIEAQLSTARAERSGARALRQSLPSHDPVTRALLAVEAAAQAAERARRRAIELERDRRRAEEEHAEAVDKSRRVAANLGLVGDEESLRAAEQAVTLAEQTGHRAVGSWKDLERSLRYWRQAADRWGQARDDAAAAARYLQQATGEHEPVAAGLAAIEERVDAAYREVVAAIEARDSQLERTRHDLKAAREVQLGCNTALVEARRDATDRDRDASEEQGRCLAAIPELRRVFAVPGLVASATTDPSLLHVPVEESVAGVRRLAGTVTGCIPAPGTREVAADGVRQSLRQRRDALGAGWDAEDRQPDESLPLMVEINGPQGRFPLAEAVAIVEGRRAELSVLLSSEQDQALRNLLQGLVAREVSEKLHSAEDLVRRMNKRLDSITTSHGIGVSIRWRRRDGLAPELSEMIRLMGKPPDLRTSEEDVRLRAIVSAQLDLARRENPDAAYTDLVGHILDYREWHEIILLLRRPGRPDERLTRRTALSEGEKKIVSYLPLFAAVAASCDSLAESAPDTPRFLLLDDAFAKVSEDNHPKLFGLLVELDLDFIATSERLWGTHNTVPELAITEVVRDATLGVIVLEHSRWDSSTLTSLS